MALWLGHVMLGKFVEGPVLEHRAVLDQAAQVRDGVGVVLQALLQFGVALTIEQEDVRALGRGGRRRDR